MLTLICFTLFYLILSFGVSAAGKLIMLTIEPGEIFGRWQRVLSRMKSRPGFMWEFWYKSLGGCETCTTQRLAEISFAGLVILFTHSAGYWPVSVVQFDPAPLAWIVRAFLNFGLYLFFCGMVMYFSQALSKKNNNSAQAVEKDYPDDVIVRTTPTPKK